MSAKGEFKRSWEAAPYGGRQSRLRTREACQGLAGGAGAPGHPSPGPAPLPSSVLGTPNSCGSYRAPARCPPARTQQPWRTRRSKAASGPGPTTPNPSLCSGAAGRLQGPHVTVCVCMSPHAAPPTGDWLLPPETQPGPGKEPASVPQVLQGASSMGHARGASSLCLLSPPRT